MGKCMSMNSPWMIVGSSLTFIIISIFTNLYMYLLPTGSEEHEVLLFGSRPITF